MRDAGGRQAVAVEQPRHLGGAAANPRPYRARAAITPGGLVAATVGRAPGSRPPAPRARRRSARRGRPRGPLPRGTRRPGSAFRRGAAPTAPSPAAMKTLASVTSGGMLSAACEIAAATSAGLGHERRHEDHDDRVCDTRAADRLERTAVVGGAGGRDHVDRIPERRLGREEAPPVARAAAAGSSATSSPLVSQASAQRIPGPPALVTITTREPRGGGCEESSAATSNSSPSVSVRITPAWRNSASIVTSEAASSAPVCDDGCPRTRRRAAALDRDDRLAVADSPGDPGELARVSERLEVEQDHVGVRVLLPVLEEVVARQVGLVADRDERRQPEAQAVRGFDDRDPEAAALREEADAPGRRRERDERRVEPHLGRGVEHAEAVGADQPHAVRAADLDQLALRRRALGSHLGEAGGDHDEAAHARGPALARDFQRPWRPVPRSRPGPPRSGCRSTEW